jgi:hypothetical protein
LVYIRSTPINGHRQTTPAGPGHLQTHVPQHTAPQLDHIVAQHKARKLN